MTATPPPLPRGKRPSPRPPPPVAGAPVANTISPTVISCKNCAGSCKIRDVKASVMIVCEYCGCAMDISTPGVAKQLVMFKKEQLPSPLAIGDQGKISGHLFTVIGRVRYEQREDGFRYIWDEFQLYNPQHGYIFLAWEDGHWTLYRGQQLSRKLPDPRHLSYKDTFAANGTTFRVHEAGGRAAIDYIEGELSWIANKGDRITFMDAIAPPNSMSAEWTDKELEWYYGRYQTREQVAAAFGKDIKEFPESSGMSPLQLFQRTKAQRVMSWAGSIVAVVCLMMSCHSMRTSGQVVLQEQIPFASYMSEQGGFTQPFTVPAGNHIYKLTMQASVRNAWLASSIAIVDEQDNVVVDAEGTSEYYSGRDSEGSWSEGSQSDSTLFRLKGPATLRLNVFGATGGWVGGDSTPQMEVPLTIQLVQGVLPARYFLIAFLLAALYPLKEMLRKWTFHSRRWPSEEE